MNNCQINSNLTQLNTSTSCPTLSLSTNRPKRMSLKGYPNSALMGAALVALVALAQCRPLNQVSSSTKSDPMLALDSDGQVVSSYVQQQPVQYVYEQQLVPQAYSTQYRFDARHEPSMKPEMYSADNGQRYVLVEQTDQVSYMPRQTEQREYAPVASAPAQAQLGPAEMMYVEPNSEPAHARNEPERDLSSMAGLLSRNGALPATILTEVPVDQMPAEVLEKLKKEYGVKVVATRSYPGANLIINCEDYGQTENMMCAQKQPSDYSAPYRQLAPAQVITYEVPSQPGNVVGQIESTEAATEQPQIPSDIVTSEQPASYDPSAQGGAHGQQAEPLGKVAAPEGEERYVYVQEAAERGPEQTNEQSRQEEPSSGANQSRDGQNHDQGDKHEHQGQLAPNQDQQPLSGFDEPAPGADEPESNSEGRYMRS